MDLSCRDSGLVQPLHSLLGAVDYAGESVLSGGLTASPSGFEAGGFQHGPGLPVYEPGVHRAFGRGRDSSQHGWTGPGL